MIGNEIPELSLQRMRAWVLRGKVTALFSPFPTALDIFPSPSLSLFFSFLPFSFFLPREIVPVIHCCRINLEAEGSAVASYLMVGWAGNLSPEGQCLVPGQLADGLGWRLGVGGGEMGSLTCWCLSREGCEAGHPGTVHLGPCTQPLQHGGCRVARLLPWPLGAPRKDSSRDKE